MPDPHERIQSAAAFIAKTPTLDAEALARIRAEYERRLRADVAARLRAPDPSDPH